MTRKIESYLTDHFLIAMPDLQDLNFRRTVTYICEHNDEGAMGIVINNPINLSVREIFEQLDIESANTSFGNQEIYLGGPVSEDRGFILHKKGGNWTSTLKINDEISITTSRDILEAMARGEGPEETLVALGYAGWAPGQLEGELAQNAWLSGPADTDIIFKLPAEKRWHAAAQLLGVDLSLLSTEAGHA